MVAVRDDDRREIQKLYAVMLQGVMEEDLRV